MMQRATKAAEISGEAGSSNNAMVQDQDARRGILEYLNKRISSDDKFLKTEDALQITTLL